MQFWQPYQKIFSKKHRFAAQIPKKRLKKTKVFRTKVFFPQIVLLYMWNPDVNNLPKISRQKSEIHLLEFREWWKSCPFSKKNYFSPKCSSEHAQWNYGKPAVTFLPRIRKSFPNCNINELTFFWTKFFFHQIRFFSNGKMQFSQRQQKLFSKNRQICSSYSENDGKNYEVSERKIFFLKMFLIHVECSCDNPAKSF